MSSPQAPVTIISSVTELAGPYEAWMCDVWGVVHNGEHPCPDAVEACRRFRETGGVVVLISNSPRPNTSVADQLSEIGVPGDSYDAIVTSGDTTRQVLKDRAGQSFFHLGPARDKPLFEELGLQPVDLDQADYVLCSGLYDDVTETPDDYAELLAQLRARAMVMVCANPDVQVERGDRLIYCAGALAAAYEKLGGEVIYTGKPHPPIYDLALAQIRLIKGTDVALAQILCIGDGVKTDIAGAVAAGIDALYVASALHIDSAIGNAPLDEDALAAVFSGSAPRPLAAQKSLKW